MASIILFIFVRLVSAGLKGSPRSWPISHPTLFVERGALIQHDRLLVSSGPQALAFKF
jgi:hypothetical protein